MEEKKIGRAPGFGAGADAAWLSRARALLPVLRELQCLMILLIVIPKAAAEQFGAQGRALQIFQGLNYLCYCFVIQAHARFIKSNNHHRDR